MDVEGAEFYALKGLGSLRPRMIFLELSEDLFNNGNRLADTHDLFVSMNYELVLDLGMDRLYLHRDQKIH